MQDVVHDKSVLYLCSVPHQVQCNECHLKDCSLKKTLVFNNCGGWTIGDCCVCVCVCVCMYNFSLNNDSIVSLHRYLPCDALEASVGGERSPRLFLHCSSRLWASKDLILDRFYKSVISAFNKGFSTSLPNIEQWIRRIWSNKIGLMDFFPLLSM